MQTPIRTVTCLKSPGTHTNVLRILVSRYDPHGPYAGLYFNFCTITIMLYRREKWTCQPISRSLFPPEDTRMLQYSLCVQRHMTLQGRIQDLKEGGAHTLCHKTNNCDRVRRLHAAMTCACARTTGTGGHVPPVPPPRSATALEPPSLHTCSLFIASIKETVQTLQIVSYKNGSVCMQRVYVNRVQQPTFWLNHFKDKTS